MRYLEEFEINKPEWKDVIKVRQENYTDVTYFSISIIQNEKAGDVLSLGYICNNESSKIIIPKIHPILVEKYGIDIINKLSHVIKEIIAHIIYDIFVEDDDSIEVITQRLLSVEKTKED